LAKAELQGCIKLAWERWRLAGVFTISVPFLPKNVPARRQRSQDEAVNRA